MKPKVFQKHGNSERRRLQNLTVGARFEVLRNERHIAAENLTGQQELTIVRIQF